MKVRLLALSMLLPLAGWACGGGSSARDAAIPGTADAALSRSDGNPGLDGGQIHMADGSVDGATSDGMGDAPAGRSPEAGSVVDANANGGDASEQAGDGGPSSGSGGTSGGSAGASGGSGMTGAGNGSGNSGAGASGGIGTSCPSDMFDGGGGLCMPIGSYSPGYHDGGNGVAAPIGSCSSSFHDGGDGLCLPSGSYSPGYHDGGGGIAAAIGACLAGYRDNGIGLCTSGKCLSGLHDGGDGNCMPGGACSLGYHMGKSGACVPTIRCAEGLHDGGDETCVANGACSVGFHDGGNGICVPTDRCVLGYKLNISGACQISLAGVHDAGNGIYLPLGFCATGYHDDGRGNCVSTGCSPGYAFVGECVPRFTSVSAGAAHTCALKTDGTVACWGVDDGTRRIATPPSGPFVAISAGGGGPRYTLSGLDHTCGLRPDGTVACWGTNSRLTWERRSDGTYAGTWGTSWSTLNGVVTLKEDLTDGGQSSPPPGQFQSISAGGCHNCGIRLDGSVACWGCNQTIRTDILGQIVYAETGQARPPAGTFTSVSAGRCHTCGVRTDGTVACWGCDDSMYYDQDAKAYVIVPGGQSSPPFGTFRSVSAGVDHTCGIRTDGTVACWGNDKNGAVGSVGGIKRSCGQASPPLGKFVSVSSGYGSTCGMKEDGTVVCWGCAKPDPLQSGVYSVYSVGASHFCGVRPNGSLNCSGTSAVGNSIKAFLPTDRVLAISQGLATNEYVCTVSRSGSLTCAGGFMKPFTPPGVFLSVSGAADLLCAIKDDGTLSCWSWSTSPYEFVASETPPGTFASVSTGKKFACAIRTDETLACWGDNTYGQATPPSGTFNTVAVHTRHACGIRTDGTALCWGDNASGQAAAPPGAFLSLTLKESLSCGVKVDGSVVCWGSNASSMSSKNTGAAIAFDKDNLWTLGTDGTIACQDGYSYEPGCPSGIFRTLVNGYNSVCAIDAAGFPVCWGRTGITP